MCSQIDDVTLSIEEANTAMIQYGNSIRDISWEVFDLLQGKISHIIDESKFLTELLSNEELYNDKGQLTNEGLTTMGLHGMNYNVYMAQADRYDKEIDNLDKQIAEDPYDKELVERRQELLELQQDMILAAEDEKQAIKDMVEDGIEKELDSLRELIDTYTEALDAQKDLYDYQKRVKEQTKEIANLQKILDAYQGDNSEEAKAKIQEYKVSLEEAKDNLEETEYDKYVSDQKKMLDTLYDEYEEILNKRLDDIEMLISDMIAKINENASSINTTLSEKADSVGYDLSTSMEQIWNTSTGELSNVLTTYGDNLQTGIESATTTINDTLGLINVNIQNMISQLNTLASMKMFSNNTSSDPNDAFSSVSSMLSGLSKPTSATSPKKTTTNLVVDAKYKANGKAEVGDMVTYKSGNYFKNSNGTGSSGNKHKGDTVYITKIKKGAKKPYHISTGKKYGSGNLGWVNLSQLKGYAKGTDNVPYDQMAFLNEHGNQETIIRKSDGAILKPLSKGDKVLNPKATKALYNIANDYSHNFNNAGLEHIDSAIHEISKMRNNMVNNSEVHLTMNLPNVTNYDEFIERVPYDLVHNKKFVGAIQAMTVGEISGGSSLAKYKFIKH